MPHIYVANERSIHIHFVGGVGIDIVTGNLIPHGVEDLLYGVLSESTLTEYVFGAGEGMSLHDSYACAFLTAVVLLLHEEIQSVKTIGICAVLLFIVFKRFEQANHSHATLVSEYLHRGNLLSCFLIRLHFAHGVACQPYAEFLENLVVHLPEHYSGMDLTSIELRQAFQGMQAVVVGGAEH